MPKIKCIGCGASKIISTDNITLQVILDNGFNYVWNVSNGLTNEILCHECSEKIRGHVHAIEDIIKIEIGLLHLGDYSKLSLNN
jgi:hypothetical protein